MANRTAKFVSGVVATLLAGAPLTMLPHSAAGAPDACLSKPNGAAPEGQHWYYRIDHANNKRQCWYLRAEGDKAAQAVSPNAAAQTGSAPPKSESTAQRSIQDAHAEYPWPQARGDQNPASGSTARQTPPVAADPATAPDNQNAEPARAQGAGAEQPAVAARWPQSAESASPPAEPAQPTLLADATATGKALPSSSVAPASAAAPDGAVAKPASPIRTLLFVIAGALALAGATASLVFRFGRARRREFRETRLSARVNWDAAGDMATPPWTQDTKDASALADLPAVADQALHPAEPDLDRITELLEQLMKQGPKLDRTISAADPADCGQSRPGQPGVPA